MEQRGYTVPGTPTQTVYPISEKDAAMERVPWLLPFEPAAQIATGATGIVDQVISWQDFVATRIGFTSEPVGFPAGPGRWKVQIQDVGASRSFQPEGFDITALIGGNFGVSDNPNTDMPCPWVFLEKTTVRITFENLAGLAALPHLLLIGYLTNWKRDAAAALAQQELQLAALQNQARSPREF